MIIEWSITKKRGNFRPVLSYTIRLEEFEIQLALPGVLLQSTIPEPPQPWSSSCLPATNERAGEQCSTHRIYTPDHKTAETGGRLTLPWREDCSYPEVKESFTRLRADFETVLREAYSSLPIEENGRLELSAETKRHIADGIVSEKFLKAVGF